MLQTRQGIVFAAAALVPLLVGLAVASEALFSPRPPHNDLMYLGAGHLVGQGHAPYLDFPYLQSPYLPYVYGAFSATVDRLALAAQLFTIGVFVAFAVVLGLVAARVSRSPLVGSGAAVLLLLNPIFFEALREPSNYTLSAVLAGFSTLALWRGLQLRRARWALAAGALLALSAGVKVYTLALAPVFGVACLIYWRAGILPLTAGGFAGLAGLLPFVLSDPAAFWFNNFEFHGVTAEWRAETGAFAERIPISGKLSYLGELAATPATLLTAALAAAAIYLRRRQRSVLLLGGTLAAALAAALLPSPMWAVYLTLPLAVAVTALVALAVGRFKWLIPAAGFLLLAFEAPDLAYHLTRVPETSRWTANQTHAVGQQIRQALEEEDLEGKIATLEPTFAAEAGAPIYPELAAGLFTYRIAQRLSAKERRRFHVVGPEGIEAFLTADPPAAVFVHDEIALSEPLVDFARRNGYRPQRIGLGMLWLRR